MSSLTDVELATGIVFGTAPVEPLPSGTGIDAAPRAARSPSSVHGPCFVSFSGGKDSSVVLAAATRAARRSGLADPCR